MEGVSQGGLNILRHHLYRSAWAFGNAHAAAFAIIVVELEPFACPQFYYSVIRANGEAIVALEAIAARHTAASFEQGVCLI